MKEMQTFAPWVIQSVRGMDQSRMVLMEPVGEL